MGQHFDRVCSIVENNFPKLLPVVQQAALFEFEQPPQEFLPKVVDYETLSRDFFLPFHVTAFEDAAGVVVVWDAHEDAIGPDHKRFSIIMHPMIAPAGTFTTRDGSEAQDRVQRAIINQIGEVAAKRMCVFGFGFADRLIATSELSYNISYTPTHGGIYDGSKLAVDHPMHLDNEATRELGRTFAIHTKTAIEEAAWVNCPDRFIVESRPVKIKPRSDKARRTRARRSFERPVYTVLRPHEARERMGLPMPMTTGGKKAAHERRAHSRYLAAERFKAKRFKWTHVKTSWIGPTEAVVGNRHYKVHTDRPSVTVEADTVAEFPKDLRREPFGSVQ